MSRKIPPVRYIKPGSVRIGDVIKIDEKVKDVETTRVGVVGSRQHEKWGTDYLSPEGVLLFTHWRETDVHPRITRLNSSNNVIEIPTLF